MVVERAHIIFYVSSDQFYVVDQVLGMSLMQCTTAQAPVLYTVALTGYFYTQGSNREWQPTLNFYLYVKAKIYICLTFVFVKQLFDEDATIFFCP